MVSVTLPLPSARCPHRAVAVRPLPAVPASAAVAWRVRAAPSGVPRRGHPGRGPRAARAGGAGLAGVPASGHGGSRRRAGPAGVAARPVCPARVAAPHGVRLLRRTGCSARVAPRRRTGRCRPAAPAGRPRAGAAGWSRRRRTRAAGWPPRRRSRRRRWPAARRTPDSGRAAPRSTRQTGQTQHSAAPVANQPAAGCRRGRVGPASCPSAAVTSSRRSAGRSAARHRRPVHHQPTSSPAAGRPAAPPPAGRARIRAAQPLRLLARRPVVAGDAAPLRRGQALDSPLELLQRRVHDHFFGLAPEHPQHPDRQLHLEGVGHRARCRPRCPPMSYDPFWDRCIFDGSTRCHSIREMSSAYSYTRVYSSAITPGVDDEPDLAGVAVLVLLDHLDPLHRLGPLRISREVADHRRHPRHERQRQRRLGRRLQHAGQGMGAIQPHRRAGDVARRMGQHHAR